MQGQINSGNKEMEQISQEDEPPDKTPLLGARKISEVLDLQNIFFKFEGTSVTGTQKDRISKLHVRKAIERGYKTVSVATCGNYGASISYYAAKSGLRSMVMMPQDYSHARYHEIKQYGGEIIQMPGKYEDSVVFMHDNAEGFAWYDASPGTENTSMEFSGYGEIAGEIVSQLGHSPEFLAVPVGNGTTLSGMYEGFRELYSSGIADRIPRFIASSTAGGNPIVSSWKKRLRKIVELDPDRIVESTLNESLVAFKSFNGQTALDAIYASHGYAVSVTDAEMLRFSSIIEEHEGISVLPASSSALAAAYRVLGRAGRDRECVVVLTGRKPT